MPNKTDNERRSAQRAMVSLRRDTDSRWQDRTQDVEPMTRPDQPGTSRLDRHPSVLHSRYQGNGRLKLEGPVTLQFLPSGICLPVTLKEPMILGRVAFEEHQSFGLSRIGAYEHGVSRQHCSLRRDGSHLVITDLNSTNGTYLNGERLIPWQDYNVADGARIILGSLHVTVYFVQDVGTSGHP